MNNAYEYQKFEQMIHLFLTGVFCHVLDNAESVATQGASTGVPFEPHTITEELVNETRNHEP